MTYGYARISTAKQSLARQIENISKAFPEAVIRQEVYTGTKTEGRAEWCKLIKAVKAGDTIVFDSVSRMSRNADEGIETYFKLYEKGVNLVFLKERYIDTATYDTARKNAIPMTGTAVDLILDGVNQYLAELAKQQIRIAFDQAEKEVQDLHTRTAEGMKASGAGAKISEAKQGKTYETKKAKQAKETIRKASKDFEGNMSDIELIQLLGIARNSYYKYKAEMKEQG